MIRKLLRSFPIAWSLLLAAPVPAQAAPAKAPDEKAFLEASAKKLDAYGTLCFKNGYPRKARSAWQLVLSDYDVNDAVAR